MPISTRIGNTTVSAEAVWNYATPTEPIRVSRDRTVRLSEMLNNIRETPRDVGDTPSVPTPDGWFSSGSLEVPVAFLNNSSPYCLEGDLRGISLSTHVDSDLDFVLKDNHASSFGTSYVVKHYVREGIFIMLKPKRSL